MIYALSDLHLSLSPNVKNKSMDIFGDIWTNHASKIKKNWNSIITSQDLVLVCGDISWAMNLNDAKPDLNFIESLNGNKILTYGNHDYWWNSTNKLNQEYSTMKFIKNDYYIYKDFIIYVIKGSECPSHKLVDFNTKLYQREVSRLQSLLSKTKNLVNQKGLRSILIMHYPPTNGDLKNSKYID
ncbi:MAG: metallophosphoesterase [bacterium]